MRERSLARDAGGEPVDAAEIPVGNGHVEARVVVDILAGIVVIAAGITAVEPADGETAVAQQLLVEAGRGDSKVGPLEKLEDLGLLRERECVKFAFIDAEKATFPIAVMCRVLGVSRQAAWERFARKSGDKSVIA